MITSSSYIDAHAYTHILILLFLNKNETKRENPYSLIIFSMTSVLPHGRNIVLFLNKPEFQYTICKSGVT